MHWFNWTMVALLYALFGSFIGVTYALLTGASTSSFSAIVSYGVILGPVAFMMIMAMRKLARDTGFNIPVARAIYHTFLITFAAPVLLYAAQLIAVAGSEPKVARSFEVLKYWSIPSVFIVAVLYGIWRVMEGNRPRVVSTGGRSGGAPPVSSGGSRSAPASRPDAAGIPPRTLRTATLVA